MKKIVSLILVLAMLCGMASVACAQASLTPITTLTGDSAYPFYAVDGTSLLRSGSMGAYTLHTLDGQKLSDNLYGGLYQRYGFLEVSNPLVEGVNYNGALDLNGFEVVPCQYGVVDILSNDWVIGLVLAEATGDNYDYANNNKTSFYLISRVDVYHMPEGVVATLTRDQYVDAAAVGYCINIQDRTTGVISTYDASFNMLGTGLKYTSSGDYAIMPYTYPRDNGRCAIVDAEGNFITDYEFGSVMDPKGEYFMVCNGSDYGIVNMEGEVVVEPAYERIVTTGYGPVTPASSHTSSYEAAGYFCVHQDGKMGYVDVNGNVTCAPKYSKDIMTNNGASATLTDLTGSTILVAADGVETTLPAYDKVYALNYGSGMLYQVQDANYMKGLIDWHGNVILPLEYDELDLTGDGQYLIARKNYNVTEIYKVTYPGAAAEAAVEAPAAEQTAGGSFRENLQNSILGGILGGNAASEAPADSPADTNMDVPADVPADAPAADNTAAVSMLTGAVTLLNTDPAANKGAALALINTAAASLAGNANVAPLLTSVVTLLTADAAANGASAVTLLNTIIGML